MNYLITALLMNVLKCNFHVLFFILIKLLICPLNYLENENQFKMCKCKQKIIIQFYFSDYLDLIELPYKCDTRKVEGRCGESGFVGNSRFHGSVLE